MKPCQRCGRCCLRYGDGGLGSATEDDMERWALRPDILRYTDDLTWDLWLHPVTRDEFGKCPWLRKSRADGTYSCRIYDVRPDACRGYPMDTEQMAGDGCEMLEDGDDDELLKAACGGRGSGT